MDIVLACQTLRSPRFDFAPYSGVDIDTSLLLYQRPDHPLGGIGSGFSVLARLSSSASSLKLQKTLDYISLYTLGVDDYASGAETGLSLHILAEQRNFVQHNIMRQMDLHPRRTPDDGDRIILLCHLATIIYSLLCVFPLPGASFKLIVRCMMSHFVSYDFSHELNKAPQLMIWIFYMAGIASIGQLERSWVIARLSLMLDDQKRGTWEEMKRCLGDHLWLPRTNDRDGISLWNEYLRSRPAVIIDI